MSKDQMTQKEYQKQATKTEADPIQALARIIAENKRAVEFSGGEVDTNNLSDYSYLSRLVVAMRDFTEATKKMDFSKKEIFYGKETRPKPYEKSRESLTFNSIEFITSFATYGSILNQEDFDYEELLSPDDLRVIHAIVGIATEAGELINVLVEHLHIKLMKAYDILEKKDFDISESKSKSSIPKPDGKYSLIFQDDNMNSRRIADKLKDELGDLEWYKALLFSTSLMEKNFVSRDEVLKANVEKLKKRYDGGEFDSEKAIKKSEEKQEDNGKDEEE